MDRIFCSYCDSSRFKILRASGGRAVTLILLLLFFIGGFPVTPESGAWTFQPQVIELADGTLLDPSLPGAAAYWGIRGIRFLREDLAVLELQGQEISAFYREEMLDTGRILEFQFQDGRILTMKMSPQEGDSHLFLYRMAEDLFPDPLDADAQDHMAGSDSMNTGMTSAETIVLNDEGMTEEEEKILEVSAQMLITGVMSRR